MPLIGVKTPFHRRFYVVIKRGYGLVPSLLFSYGIPPKSDKYNR
jgi:hypothetical protein